MKKIYLLLLASVNMFAQIPNNTAPKYLDKNKVKARVNTVNNKFWNIYGNGANAYEVPVGKGAHAQFANSIWIGGFDAGGQLHISANTYRQAGIDFWPGPLDTTNIAAFTLSNTAVYNKLWKVDCNDINNFIAAYNAGSVAANTYTVPTDIANYPAVGMINFQRHLEPFYDANGNGQYNPVAEGDYPLIKGHQQILSIYNDSYGTHTETSGAPSMGLEIHERAYAYYDANLPDSMKAVNHSTFHNYTIYNRSNTTYTNVFISDWSDVDLGYYLDDFIGSDTANNFAYCYNADAVDETAAGVVGYGNKPPVVSHAILKTPCLSDGIDNNGNGTIDESGEQFLMNRTTYYNDNIGGVPAATTNPDSAIHYYRFMSGYWKNNTPFTQGGNAYGGTRKTNYVYTGDPSTNTGWTEGSAGNTAGDRRIIFSSGPFTFPAHSKIEWGFAVVFSQDTSQNVNTITQFTSRVQRDVRNVRYYDQQYNGPQCMPAITLGVKELETQDFNATIYPNPAQNNINIQLAQTIDRLLVSLRDLTGRVVKERVITNSNHLNLDLSGIAAGVYFVELKSNRSALTQRIIKSN